MVFATLITPTDPVGVISTLKSVRVPSQLETTMSGEALFNDGIAIVLSTVAVHAAAGTKNISLIGGLGLILLEADGGALLGLVTGYLAYRALNVVDEYTVEFMVTLALVMFTYALAMMLHVSGSISVVVGARFLAVAISVNILGRWRSFVKGTVPVLTWGGVRGGISVALALSLPRGQPRSVIQTATYAVVVFTLVVQGLSLAWVVRRVVPDANGETNAWNNDGHRSDANAEL